MSEIILIIIPILKVLTLVAVALTVLRYRKELDKVRKYQEQIEPKNIPEHPRCRCSITLMEPLHNDNGEKIAAAESAVVTVRYLKPAKSHEHTESAAFMTLTAKQNKEWNKWRHYSRYSKRLRIRLKYRKRLEAWENER